MNPATIFEEHVIQWDTLSVSDILSYSSPLHSGLSRLLFVLFFLPFIFLVIAKILDIKAGKTTIITAFFQLICFIVFVMSWPKIFKFAYYLNDATAAKINNISLNSPKLVNAGYHPSNNEFKDLFDEMAEVYEDVESKREEVKKQLNKADADNSSTSIVSDALDSLSKGSSYLFLKFLNPLRWIRTIIEFLVHLVREIVVMVRLGFSFFFYIAIPFLIIFSYMPILGDNQDLTGLNKFSKSTINWFFNMAMWPTFYALLDKVLVIIYYALKANHIFEGYNSSYSAFFCFVLISYITIPISIQKANPYGVMHGMISTISTAAIVGGSFASIAMKSSGISKMMGSKLSNFKPKSNVDLAKGDDSNV